MKRLIMAYSGGLDTTYCLHYLKAQGYSIVTTTINTGGFSPQELSDIESKAYQLGAEEHITLDGRNALWRFAKIIIKGEYLRGGVYPICVAPERCAIVPELVRVAREKDTHIFAHGSTGAGGDQVRFDNALRALMPQAKIITPIREQGLSRTQTARYLKEQGHPVDLSVKDYSINIGLLGTSIGGKETLGTLEPLPDEAFPSVKPLDQTPSTPETVTIGFSRGVPVSLDHKTGEYGVLQELNQLGAKHGYGKGYHVGTSLLGIPARLGFEAPGMLALIDAHQNLAKVVLTKEEMIFLKTVGEFWGNLIHAGRFYHPVAKAYEVALDALNERLNGEVKMKFYKGHLCPLSVVSPASRFENNHAKYGEEIDVDGKAMAEISRLFDQDGIWAAQQIGESS
jgi:argininosuccinate synthase